MGHGQGSFSVENLQDKAPIGKDCPVKISLALVVLIGVATAACGQDTTPAEGHLRYYYPVPKADPPTCSGTSIAAATAACMAIDANIPVQEVPYDKLRRRLLDDGQQLDPPAKKKALAGDTKVKAGSPHFFRHLAAGEKQTVVIYGTSLSHGGAWADAMKRWFDNEYPGLVTVINNSGPGQNSAWGVANLRSKVLGVRPDLVFVEFSYNDAVDRFKLPVDKAAENLAAIVRGIRSQDPGTTIVLQIMNVGWDAPNGRKSFSSRPALERYNDTYRTFAKLHDLTLLDHYANWIRLKENDPQKFQALVPDGSHPSKEGSLAVTWPTVKAWLEDARR